LAEEDGVAAHRVHLPVTIEDLMRQQQGTGSVGHLARQHQAALDLQETAGNTAVSAMIGERGVQRQPSDVDTAGGEPAPADNKAKPVYSLSIDKLVDKLPVISFSLAEGRTAPSGRGTNREQPPEPRREIRLMVPVDAESEKLMREAMMGSAGHEHATINGPTTIELTDVTIDSYSVGSSGDQPVAYVTISCASLKVS
jgi:hypothetical protein